jgi:hypothetical protein
VKHFVVSAGEITSYTPRFLRGWIPADDLYPQTMIPWRNLNCVKFMTLNVMKKSESFLIYSFQ